LPRPKQRTDELRAHVLHRALEMLERDGVLGFTARRIADEAGTSMPAVYELFGDKAGLLREVFFEGFRLLLAHYEALPETSDPRADLFAVLHAIRGFVAEHPVLAELMFGRPFADFDPGPADLKAGTAVRNFVIRRVKRCLDAEILRGDATDIAHVLVALVQGLSAQQRAGWLGRSKASIDRRFQLALQAMLEGLAR
jgi:AcrR family transcriptional regulator